MGNKKNYKGIDLFCGIGGFRLAMQENNVQCVFSSDNDRFAQETYKANFGETPKGDIKEIEAKDIPPFDILTAGFPCQPFSYAGEKQKRERWYCVAFRKEIDFEWPEPIGGHPILRDIVDLNNDDPSLRLPQFELDRIDYHFAVAQPGDRVQHDNSKYASNTKKGKYGIYSFQKPDGSLRFHVGDFAKTQIQEAFYSCLDTYASTIIANRTPKLWDIRRKLSVLEAQRLQGFPDDFMFPVSDAQAYHQLGNSVSVPIIKLIMANMIKTYEKTLEQ